MVTVNPKLPRMVLDPMIRMGAHPAPRPRLRPLDAGDGAMELGACRMPTLPKSRRTRLWTMCSGTSLPPTATSRDGSCRG